MYTEKDIINYMNAWQSDGKHLDSTAEEIKEWLQDDGLYTESDKQFFLGWTDDDYLNFAKAIRGHRDYED